jgi:hypothetical protein
MLNRRAAIAFGYAALILVLGCASTGCSNALNYEVAGLTDQKRVKLMNALTADQRKKLDDWIDRHPAGSKGVRPGVTVRQALIDEDAWLAEQKKEAARTEELKKKAQTVHAAEQAKFAGVLSVTLLSKKNKVSADDQRVVTLEIACDNKGDKPIRTVAGALKLTDVYGNKIMDVNWSYGRVISAKQTVVDHDVIVSISQSLDPQVKLWGTDFDQINATFEANAIVFTDGTSMKARDAGA